MTAFFATLALILAALAVILAAIAVLYPATAENLKGILMGIVEDLAAANAKADELLAQVEEANGKTDALILVANQTKDALVALQQQQLPPEVAEQVAALTGKLQAGIDSLNAQDAETDEAAAAVAP